MKMNSLIWIKKEFIKIISADSMKKNILIFLLVIPSCVNAQEISIRALPYFYAADVQGYNFSGFNIGVDYSLTKEKVINRFIDVEFSYSILSKVGEISSYPTGYISSLKLGYKFMYFLYELLMEYVWENMYFRNISPSLDPIFFGGVLVDVASE